MRTYLILFAFIIFSIHLYAQWEESNNGMYGGMTTCFVIKDGYLFAGSTGGLYRSSDNGTNWEHIYNGLPLDGVRSLIVDGTSIFAGTSASGIYVTTNNGASWSQSNTGLTNHAMLSFLLKGVYLFAGTSNGGLFVSTNNGGSWTLSNSGIPNAGVNNFITIGDSIYITSGAGVYLSSDNGSSWVARNNGLTSTIINSITYDGTILYAASHTNGVFISTNKGDNWSNASNGITNLSILDIKNNITKCFAATNGGGVFYTTNGGSNWLPASNGLYNTYVLKLFIHSSDMYAGSDGGVFYTTNEGTNWTDITSGLTNSVIIYLANDGLGNIYAGTYGRGVFKSTNNGTSWFEINNGLEELYCYSNIAKSNFLFGGLWNGQVCRSTDSGGSWLTVVPKTTSRTIVWSFAVIGNNVFHGNSVNGVYLSTDNGLNWSAVNNGLTNKNVRCMTASGTNLFAGTSGGGVFLSSNNGANWQSANNGLPNLNINCLTASGGNIYAGTTSNGVCISTNNGTSWQTLSNGMTSHARSIAVNGTNIIAATPNGVFYSTNSGANWQAGNSGSLNFNDWALLIIGTDVYLGTFGNGTFKAPLSAFSSTGLTSITTGAVQTSICDGSAIQVPYTITGTFNPGNTFTAQLSNSSGSITLPTNIGSVTSTTTGTITCVIPGNTAPGSAYRIRVVGSKPSTTGSDNGADITINALPVPLIQGSKSAIKGSAEHYSTQDNSGSHYQWFIDGGSINGADTTNEVDVLWGEEDSGVIKVVETTNYGCVDSDSIAVTLVVNSVQDRTDSGISFNIIPNPVITGAEIEIKSDKAMRAGIRIFNSLGIVVKEFNNVILNEGTKKLLWNGCFSTGEAVPAGIYFIKLSGKFGVIIEKAVVMR